MKKLGFPTIMLLLAGAIGVGVWSYFYAPVPVRIRRLVQTSFGETGAKQQRATRALEQMGERAIPSLLKLLKHPNSTVRRRAIKAFGLLKNQERDIIRHLQTALADTDWRVRRQAARALGDWHWRAYQAVPHLLRALRAEKEWLVKRHIVAALGKIGPFAKEALPTLQQTLGDKDYSVRYASLQALRKIGLKPSAAVRIYQKQLNDQHWRVRTKAAQELGRIGPKAAPAFPLLVVSCRDSHKKVRATAINALKRIGPQAIQRALTSKNSWEQIAAAQALQLIGEQASIAVPALQRAANTQQENVQRAALKALSQVGHDGLSAYLSLLDDAPAQVRAAAAKQLKSLGTLAVVAAPSLYRMLRADEQRVRWAAAQAISRLPPTLPTLRTLLNHKTQWIRLAAVQSLGRLGPKAVLILLEALSNPATQVRQLAAQALGQLHSPNPMVIRDLTVALKDNEDNVKIAAAKALLKQGQEGKNVFTKHLAQSSRSTFLMYLRSVPVFKQLPPKLADEFLLRLRRSLGSRLADHKVQAAQILGQLGPKAGLATFLLNKLLEDPDQRVRVTAIEALSRIGKQAHISVPGLLSLVLKKTGEEQLSALRTLIALSEHTPKAVQALRRPLRHTSISIRRLGVKALAQLGEDALPALPDLLWALEDPRIRADASVTIRQIGPKAVPALLSLLQHQQQWVRWTGIEIVASFGPKAKAAIPLLHKALYDPVTPVRIAAARALQQIDPQHHKPTSRPTKKGAPKARPTPQPTSRPVKR